MFLNHLSTVKHREYESWAATGSLLKTEPFYPKFVTRCLRQQLAWAESRMLLCQLKLILLDAQFLQGVFKLQLYSRGYKGGGANVLQR